MKRIDVKAGDRFGRLTVVREEPANYKRRFLCRCDCGVEKVSPLGDLRFGKTKSCGCLTRGAIGDLNKTHGKSKTKLHTIWSSMKQRCHNPNSASYPQYGGRGIKVCKRWRKSFEAFEADMGPRPSPKHSVDRIDNNRGYSPKNCRWATNVEQCNNSRVNTWLTFNGVSMTARDWAVVTGIPRDVILNRNKIGWSIERTLTQKVKHYPNSRAVAKRNASV